MQILSATKQGKSDRKQLIETQEEQARAQLIRFFMSRLDQVICMVFLP